VVAELQDYVKELLNQGYPPDTVRSQMIAYGYSRDAIDGALAAHTTHHVIDLSPRTVIVIVCLVAGIGVMAGGLFYWFTPGDALLDLTPHPVQTEVSPGSALVWVNEVTNLGGRRRFDVELRHEARAENGTTVASRTETIAIETRASTPAQLQLPVKLAPGEYTLLTTARYAGKRATASFKFVVSKPASAVPLTCFDDIQNQGEEGVDCGGPCSACLPPEDTQLRQCVGGCDDFDSCTVDSCVTGRCVNSPKVPCCGNFNCEQAETPLSCAEDCALKTIIKTPDQLIAEASKLAVKSPSQAAGLCASILQSAYADKCYGIVAQNAKQSSYCVSIQDPDTKDGCYLNYAQVTNDYNICSKLKNRLYRSSCESFKLAR